MPAPAHSAAAPAPDVAPDRASTAVCVRVDYRERQSGVLEALRALPGVTVSLQSLRIGDYEVDGRMVFERKRLRDFAVSIQDGRLFRQACRLAGLPEPGAIILEGRASDLAGCGMQRESFQGALISLSLVFQLPVFRSLDPQETARLMVYAGRQMERCPGFFIHRGGRRPRRKRTAQLRILCSLPGVGPHRALRLLESLGSVAAVIAASPDALQTVEGIGAKTAARIRWALD